MLPLFYHKNVNKQWNPGLLLMLDSCRTIYNYAPKSLVFYGQRGVARFEGISLFLKRELNSLCWFRTASYLDWISISIHTTHLQNIFSDLVFEMLHLRTHRKRCELKRSRFNKLNKKSKTVSLRSVLELNLTNSCNSANLCDTKGQTVIPSLKRFTCLTLFNKWNI